MNDKPYKKRIEVLILIAFLVILALITRLVYLQIIDGDYYSKLADGNRIRLIPAMAPRGIFYDRNGVIMVSNRPGFTVSLLTLSGPIDDSVIVRLADVLKMNKDEIYE